MKDKFIEEYLYAFYENWLIDKLERKFILNVEDTTLLSLTLSTCVPQWNVLTVANFVITITSTPRKVNIWI